MKTIDWHCYGAYEETGEWLEGSWWDLNGDRVWVEYGDQLLMETDDEDDTMTLLEVRKKTVH